MTDDIVSADNKFPPSPFAKYQGRLQLGEALVDCYVLDTEDRVISLRATVKAITDREGGNLGEYIGVQALKAFINKDLILGETIEFNIPGTESVAKRHGAKSCNPPLRNEVGEILAGNSPNSAIDSLFR